MQLILISKSEQDTKIIGQEIAQFLEAGDVITLEGDLGAGKTTFTKGLAEGLSITEAVTSPTFTIIKEYEGALPLYHMDVYRLEFADEDLGFDEYFFGDGITVVEWATFIQDYLPDDYLAITIEHQAEHERKITFVSNGARYEKLLTQIKQSQLGRFIR